MPHALHIVASALGCIPDGLSLCAICGESPFAAGPLLESSEGPNLGDWTGLLPHPHVCRGCVECMAGKPGRQPPPLRMRSLVCDASGLCQGRARDLWPFLAAVSSAPVVLSWAESGQRHHVLSAGVSQDGRLLVGSDGGRIVFDHARDGPLRDAVLALLSGRDGKPVLSREAVLTGGYNPSALQRFGIGRWRDLESVVGPRRGERVLDLIVACAPCEDAPEEQPVSDAPATSSLASLLLEAIAQGSEVRRKDGLTFWGGFFRHRIERFCRHPLAQFVSRMLDECRVPATASPNAAAVAAAANPTDVREAEQALRTQAALLVALTFDVIQAKKRSRL